MAGYIRQDTSDNIADGKVINASDFDNEYNAIEAAFHAATGHTHDGTAAEGAPITKIGPTQDVVASASALRPKTDNTVDLGSASFEFKDLYLDGVANIDSLVADTADINAGTIDGVTIGGSVRGAGSFTTLDVSGAATLGTALAAASGGTGQSSYTTGDLLYATGTTALSKLGIGASTTILTSSGTAPQWTAASSVAIGTATNLAGGAAGSVPYQSGAATTTFLGIGAANTVMTSSGSAPQWVTSLTGLTGVSSSSITNTSLTPTRLVYSTTGGAQTDSANLTYNGSTLVNNGAADGTNAFSVTGNTVGGFLALRPDGTNGQAIRVGGSGAEANTLRFLGSGDAEYMRITSGGDLLVGTTSNSTSNSNGIVLNPNGNSSLFQHTNGTASGTGYVAFIYNAGVIGSISQDGTTAVLYNTTSDRRLKQNIVPAPSASEVIDAIQIVSHVWKNAPDEHVTYGVIAQDLHAVAPQAVSAGDDGDEIERTWGVDYSKLVPMLIKEIQSLRARVAALETH